MMLARRWPSLMKKWDQVESGLPGEKNSLSLRFKIIAAILLSLSLGKFILFYFNIVLKLIYLLNFSWAYFKCFNNCICIDSLQPKRAGSVSPIFHARTNSALRVRRVFTAQICDLQGGHIDIHFYVDVYGFDFDSDQCGHLYTIQTNQQKPGAC